MIYIKRLLFYARINFQFLKDKGAELENVGKVVDQEVAWECAFLYRLW